MKAYNRTALIINCGLINEKTLLGFKRALNRWFVSHYGENPKGNKEIWESREVSEVVFMKSPTGLINKRRPGAVAVLPLRTRL